MLAKGLILRRTRRKQAAVEVLAAARANFDPGRDAPLGEQG